MSRNVTFSDTRLAGTRHSSIPELIYLDIEINGGGSISEYVPDHVARLIKAAPELLEACELVIGSLHIPDDDVSQEVKRRLAAAIAKTR